LAAGNLQPYKNDLWKIIWPFFLSANWENAKATPYLSKAFPTCCGLHLWGEISTAVRGNLMFEGGNLLNLNLTPVTKIP